MPKEFGVIDLLAKLSTNSFLLQFENEKALITPGVFLGMPGKFYLYVDILDTVMRNIYVNGKGDVMVSLEDLQQNLKPIDLNEYFAKLESTIKNKDVLGIGNENTQESKQYPIGDVKVVENKELPQPVTPTIGELEPNEKTEQNETEKKKQTKEKESGETQQSKQKTYTKKQYGYQKSGYNRTYTSGKNYQKSGYNKTSADGNTSTSGKNYQKSGYNKYTKSYKKTYKKSE